MQMANAWEMYQHNPIVVEPSSSSKLVELCQIDVAYSIAVERIPSECTAYIRQLKTLFKISYFFNYEQIFSLDCAIGNFFLNGISNFFLIFIVKCRINQSVSYANTDFDNSFEIFSL